MRSKKGIISVGEPWNFTSPDGENIIKGHIIKMVSSTCLIFKANYVLDFRDSSGEIFVLLPRYANENFNDIKGSNRYVPINALLLTTGDESEMTEDQLEVEGKFVIIGDIRIDSFVSNLREAWRELRSKIK